MCPPWLGCCVRLAGLVSQCVSHLALSFALAGVLCPPRWACLPICLSHLALSFTLAGVLCPPRWACLPICLPSGFVFQLGWGAVSASLACLRSCLPICLPPGFVFYVGWGAVSASLGLSPNLSPNLSPPGSLAGVLCPPRWACLLIPQTVYGSASLGLSPVLSPSLSPIWSWMLCPPPWSCLSLVSCLPAFVFVLSRSLSFIWDAVSARPGLVFFLSLVLSPSLSPIWSGMLCPPPWSCLSLVSGLVSQLLSLFCLVACLSSGDGWTGKGGKGQPQEYVRRLEGRHAFAKAVLRPYFGEGGLPVYSPGKTAQELWEKAHLRTILDQRNTELVRRPALGLSMACSSLLGLKTVLDREAAEGEGAGEASCGKHMQKLMKIFSRQDVLDRLQQAFACQLCSAEQGVHGKVD